MVIRPFRIASLLMATLLAATVLPQTVSYLRVAGVTGGIAAGPDGNLWFPTVNGIVKMTPAGAMTTYPVPTPVSVYSEIAAGPDGRMWFTSPSAARIIAVTMDGLVTEYVLPAGSHPRGITGGSDGRVWFGYAAGVGRITPSGEITWFPLPDPRDVLDIVEGPDGNFWFVQFPFNHVGRITPAGIISLFDVSCCIPVSIARAADGGLWVAFNSGKAIARVSTDGTLQRYYPLGEASGSGARPYRVENGPDARIWFSTEQQPPGIGRILPDGSVGVVTLHSDVSEVAGMAESPDGNFWAVLRMSGRGCTNECPPPDPTPPLALARVNLVDPAVEVVPIPTLSTGFLVLMSVVLAALALVALKGALAG